MLQKSIIKRISALTIATSVLLTQGTAYSAAQCKGTTKSVCASSDSCYWVDGYTRKDGVQVKGHCRSKGGESGPTKKKSSDSPAKKETKKETKKSTKSDKDTSSKHKKSSSEKGTKKEADKKSSSKTERKKEKPSSN